MQHQYKQPRQMQMADRPVIKQDNKLYRVQNPMRSELSLAVFFLLKSHVANSVRKVAKAYPKTNIIFGKVGGSWWKPEFRIIIGGKLNKDVQAATEMLQKSFSGKKSKEQSTNK